jgi:hypothetical protein
MHADTNNTWKEVWGFSRQYQMTNTLELVQSNKPPMVFGSKLILVDKEAIF